MQLFPKDSSVPELENYRSLANAVTSGSKVKLLGLVGLDAAPAVRRRQLEEHGVSCCFQRIAGSKTITKLRILSRHQQLLRVDFEDHFPAWNVEILHSVYLEQLMVLDAVILSDFAKVILRRIDMLINAARQAGKPVIIDPKGTDFERYRGGDDDYAESFGI